MDYVQWLWLLDEPNDVQTVADPHADPILLGIVLLILGALFVRLLILLLGRGSRAGRRPKPILGYCNKCGYCGPVKKDFRGLLVHPGCNYTAVEVKD